MHSKHAKEWFGMMVCVPPPEGLRVWAAESEWVAADAGLWVSTCHVVFSVPAGNKNSNKVAIYFFFLQFGLGAPVSL